MTGRRAWDEAQARAVIAERSAEPGAMLPILHALQERFGYIDDAAIPLVAEALNLSKAEMLGVVSFYHDFRRAPVDGAVLKLCRAESLPGARLRRFGRPSRAGAWRCGRRRRTGRAAASSRPSIASAIARCRLPLCSTANRSAGSIARRSTPSSAKATWRRRDERADVYSRRFGRALGRREPGGAGDRRRGGGARRRADHRPHRLARPLLARADDRGRDAARSLRLRPDRARRRRGRCSTSGFLSGRAHPKALGLVEDIAFLKRQQR